MITEEELKRLLDSLELRFIAEQHGIEKVDTSIITLIKIVKSLQQENKQLKEIIKQKNNHITTLYSSIKEDVENNLRRR